jgi:muconate cycloisomerase
LESSVGASAHLQGLSTFRELACGLRALRPANSESEHVTEPLRSEDFNVHPPTGPKIGVVVDEDKLRHYARS